MKPGFCKVCALSIHPSRTLCGLCEQAVNWVPPLRVYDHGYKVGHGDIPMPPDMPPTLNRKEWQMGYMDGQGDLERGD